MTDEMERDQDTFFERRTIFCVFPASYLLTLFYIEDTVLTPLISYLPIANWTSCHAGTSGYDWTC